MWNPTDYLTYADERTRPFSELVARIPAVHFPAAGPRRVVDLGCGPGNATATLARRWPAATVEALDNSPAMVEAARAGGVDAVLADVEQWVPAPDTDVVISNATLQWVETHRELLTRWPSQLPGGAVIAVQMPGNFDAPSHRLIRALASSAAWHDRLGGTTLRGPETVDDPEDYADLLAEQRCRVDAWETTYIQRLTGEDPVLEWVSGTALTPVFERLDPAGRHEFRRDLAPLLREAYPQRADGSTYFPFRRVFVVATVGGADRTAA